MTIGWVEGDGFDLDEELAWAWFRCGPGLEGEGLTFCGGDGGEVGGPCKCFRGVGLMCAESGIQLMFHASVPLAVAFFAGHY